MVIYMYSDMPESFERSHSRDHYGVVSAFHKIILMKKVKTTKFQSFCGWNCIMVASEKPQLFRSKLSAEPVSYNTTRITLKK